MPGLNFDLAPPAKVVDGLLAVPIDIQRVTAILAFDGATSSGTGDATVEFTMGAQAGRPIFDLRQTIGAAWLDGAPLAAAALAHHDFGGGLQAQLRVIDAPLAAGSAHTLRVTYALGLPQASGAGSYQPGMTWSGGPRLAFNFGFTDLGGGRYLEAWVPANLIFDQFELTLELRIDHTPVGHTLITNGAVTALGVNHWRVAFPSRCTALSPLVELRASDTVASGSDTTVLPVSGATVTVEAWTLAAGAANLPAQINNLKGYLAEGEQTTGPYMHGNRFIAFVHQGGMEYDGGTTSSSGNLRHETFHSWWARGVKPASQPDAWFDEAWTEYLVAGAAETMPFNFADDPAALCPLNPWIRVTSGDAYTKGYRFWKGIASLIGAPTLIALMGEFYRTRHARPVTTAHIEEFLVARAGNPLIVDAFHRFVYGLGDAPAPPDVWLRDDPAHAGTEAWAGRFWDSPDLWIRNADDGGVAHQPPEFGQDNWFYARVRNGGASAVPHFLVAFNVKHFAGTEFVYPQDFLPCVAAAAGFSLAQGASAIVKARWPRALVPAPGAHACLTAAVIARGDHPGGGLYVWQDNNLAQKNLTIVDLKPNRWIVIPVVVSNLQAAVARGFHLELQRPPGYPALEASLLQRSAAVFKAAPGVKQRAFDSAPTPAPKGGAAPTLDCGGGTGEAADGDETPPVLGSSLAMLAGSRAGGLVTMIPRGVDVAFPAGEHSRIPVTIRPRDQLSFGLRVFVPADAPVGKILRVDLVQRDTRSRRPMGGIAVEIRVI
jgi:hypothetical protein